MRSGHLRQRSSTCGRRWLRPRRLRASLIANVSHELRSPLTVISGYADTLLHAGPWDATTEQEFLTIVAGAAEKLGRLVDNLLDAAKAEAGTLRVEHEPVRVERV